MNKHADVYAISIVALVALVAVVVFFSSSYSSVDVPQSSTETVDASASTGYLSLLPKPLLRKEDNMCKGVAPESPSCRNMQRNGYYLCTKNQQGQFVSSSVGIYRCFCDAQCKSKVTCGQGTCRGRIPGSIWRCDWSGQGTT